MATMDSKMLAEKLDALADEHRPACAQLGQPGEDAASINIILMALARALRSKRDDAKLFINAMQATTLLHMYAVGERIALRSDVAVGEAVSAARPMR